MSNYAVKSMGDIKNKYKLLLLLLILLNNL